MGGSHDRIDVLPLSDIGRRSVIARTFAAEDAHCFNDGDRHRLLGIIEAGFGGFSRFNSLVRDALLQRGRTSGADRAWGATMESQPARLDSPKDLPSYSCLPAAHGPVHQGRPVIPLDTTGSIRV